MSDQMSIRSRFPHRRWRSVVVLLALPAMLYGQSVPAQVLAEPVSELSRIFPVPAYLLADNSLQFRNRGLAESAALQSRTGDTEEPSRWRPALLASAGLAATAALVAYWSTNKADEAYNRYLRSAGQTRQEKMLDRAERHDRIAGAGFLIMEAGLVLTARFVFF